MLWLRDVAWIDRYSCSISTAWAWANVRLCTVRAHLGGVGRQKRELNSCGGPRTRYQRFATSVLAQRIYHPGLRGNRTLPPLPYTGFFFSLLIPFFFKIKLYFYLNTSFIDTFIDIHRNLFNFILQLSLLYTYIFPFSFNCY